jgi:hypothetical protein
VSLVEGSITTPDAPTGSTWTTTHLLGEVLGCRPERLVVLGVQVADTGLGQGLSPAVAAALRHVVDRAVAEFGDGDRALGSRSS